MIESKTMIESKIMNIIKYIFIFILIILILELILGLYRNYRRSSTYRKAVQYSKKVNKPLMVIGSPSSGFMNSIYPVYGCGDLCVDLVGCNMCKNSVKDDATNVLQKKPDNSYVIFESCVLEVLDEDKKIKMLNEINRVSGGDFFEVRISPSIYSNLLAKSSIIQFGINY